MAAASKSFTQFFDKKLRGVGAEPQGLISNCKNKRSFFFLKKKESKKTLGAVAGFCGSP